MPENPQPSTLDRIVDALGDPRETLLKLMMKAGLPDSAVFAVRDFGAEDPNLVPTQFDTDAGRKLLMENPKFKGLFEVQGNRLVFVGDKYKNLPSGVTREDVARWEQDFPDLQPEQMKELAAYEREHGPWGNFASLKSGEAITKENNPLRTGGESVVPKYSFGPKAASAAEVTLPQRKPELDQKVINSIVDGLSEVAKKKYTKKTDEISSWNTVIMK